jgi:membrane protease YdiL (CAAX protease family)
MRGATPLALAIYGTLSFVTLGVALARGRSPIDTEAWLDLPEWSHHLLSLAGGGVLAVATVWSTRAFVRRWGWARTLHADLRPAIRDAGNGTLVILGVASGVAEELFFRGLLAPAVGLVLSSLAFGALHQLRGRTGWIWASWAAVMGLLFGGLFLATGSLLGPIAAHASINMMNLRFLRDTELEPARPRRLGGLLGGAPHGSVLLHPCADHRHPSASRSKTSGRSRSSSAASCRTITSTPGPEPPAGASTSPSSSRTTTRSAAPVAPWSTPTRMVGR